MSAHPGEIVAAGPAAEAASAATTSSRDFIRGSSLLLAGRVVAILLNLAVQVLTVRYLSKSDYGAFAYALAVVSMASTATLLGLGKALPRFVPLYHERGDHARAFGTIVLAAGTVLGLGAVVVLALHGFRGVLSRTLVADPLAMSVLLILIALAPLNALDNLLQKLAAVFIGARAIFFRRHVLGPGLKLIAVLVVMALAGDTHTLAYGYLAGGVIGITLYLSILTRAWWRYGLLGYLRPRQFTMPARELFGFSLPLLSTDGAAAARGVVAVLQLEYFHTTTAVAEYRAVLPVAGLNMLVFEAFAFLFVPTAARMFARRDHAAIGDLYWKTSLWISVLTFPVLAATCAMARPLTVFLFGESYESSGLILAVLAVGYYVHAAMGFNAETLRVHGRVRLIVAGDVAAASAAVLSALVLIPPFGALGAALSVSGVLVLHNLINHANLRLGHTDVHLADRRFLLTHGAVLTLLLGLIAVEAVVAPPLAVGLGIAGATSLLLVRLTRRLVNPQEAFPELLRLPVVRRLVS